MPLKWRESLVTRAASILEAMQVIDQVSTHGVVIVDEDNRLLGTVTDGDIRRAVLRGVSINDSVSSIMNKNPIFITKGPTLNSALSLMKEKQINLVPIVDDDKRIVGMEHLNDLLKPDEIDNWVVLMAGGEGQRLRPLTEECPKPLLKVGDKPLLETIIANFRDQGFKQFYVSVNYKAEMVTDYFGDGSRFGVQIQYLHETKPLGTAGALSLIPQVPNKPIIVMNGDLLTKVNFKHLLDFHRKQHAIATMCIREYAVSVPYGVVNLDASYIKSISEKPVHKFFVNAGIYVLEPSLMSVLPNNELMDMPVLFEKLLAAKETTAAFPICEYWLDIGQKEDFVRANGDFFKVFER